VGEAQVCQLFVNGALCSRGGFSLYTVVSSRLA